MAQWFGPCLNAVAAAAAGCWLSVTFRDLLWWGSEWQAGGAGCLQEEEKKYSYVVVAEVEEAREAAE